MFGEVSLPTIGVVLATAAVDSINPCAIGVLILMISVLLAQHGSVKKMLFYGSAYVFAVMMTYLIAGLGLIYFLAVIPIAVAEYLSLGVAALVMVAGLFEVKDFFWYGRGFSLAIPLKWSHKINEMAQRPATLGWVMFLGAFVAAVELPCTGAPYLAILTILRQNFNFSAFLLLVLYNIIFVSPLIIILILVASGKKLADFKAWREEKRGVMRLGIGLLLLALSWLLILIANGTVNFG